MFGRALQDHIALHGQTQRSLARKLGHSAAYLSQIMNGSKRVVPLYVDRISIELDLNDDEKSDLVTAAVQDAGWDMDLIQKPKRK